MGVTDGAIIGIVGNTGTGKTQLAVEVMKYFAMVMARGMDGPRIWSRYIRAAELATQVRAAFSKGADSSEADMIGRFCRPDLLVIDEFSEAGTSEWERRLFGLILDRRYGDMRSTFVISNGTPDDLRRIIGERAIDRMRERGRIIHFTHASFRGRQ